MDNITETIEGALPVPVRMGSDERYTGRGITVAFLDSGFYAHKDLTEPANRIIAYHNIFALDDDLSSLQTSDVLSWHGMMTSFVAAGNGHLCGRQRGTCARTPSVAAGECSVVHCGWWPRRSELTRSSAARHVSLVVWSNDRRFAKTGSDRAGNLGCWSNTSLHADCRRST